MPKQNVSIGKLLANLVAYAQDNLHLSAFDAIYARNRLLAMFKLSEPSAPDAKIPPLQTGILDPIVAYAVENGLADESEKLLFETRVMGLVTPAPSVVIAEFDAIAANKGTEAATEYLNEIGVNSNYIRMADIKKNIKWAAEFPTGDLTVTINLSKPEKSNEQVARERNMPATNYPKCLLCLENLGFDGNARHPARETIRVIPLYLNDEPWFMQFSPYVYFDGHCIAVSAEHHPMAITDKTFVRLLDFVEMFPHYFIGSNADLPIVGGSILAHEHYQGGKKVLPMFSRPVRRAFASSAYPSVNIGILDWYNSVVKLSGRVRSDVEAAASAILAKWRKYTDTSVGIIAETNAPHNTITPIATVENGDYTLYLILRNNRTDEKHPYGIYHPTEDMHNIKKEGIGLIEAMGTFILPGRLASEIRGIVDILSGAAPLDFAALSDEKNPLSKHLGMIMQLANDNGTSNPIDDAEKIIVNYVNETCVRILECTAVFKNTEIGQEAFAKFLASLDINPV